MMITLRLILSAAICGGTLASDAKINGDIISLIKALSKKVDGIESKVDKVAEDVKTLYKNTIGPINKFGLTYIGQGHYGTYGGFQSMHNVPTIELCFHICKARRDHEGDTWNGLHYHIYAPGIHICTCIRNDVGHTYQANQMHYRWE